MTEDSYFNISEIKLSFISLFLVHIMSNFGASDIIYSDVIDSFISEIMKYESFVIQSLSGKTQGRTIHTNLNSYSLILVLSL